MAASMLGFPNAQQMEMEHTWSIVNKGKTLAVDLFGRVEGGFNAPVLVSTPDVPFLTEPESDTSQSAR